MAIYADIFVAGSSAPNGTSMDFEIGQPVALSNDVAAAPITTYTWSLEDIPDGSAAILSSTSVAAPTFTPDLQGTYLVKLIIDITLATEDVDTAVVAVKYLRTKIRKPAAGERNENHATRGWAEARNRDLDKVDSLLTADSTQVAFIPNAEAPPVSYASGLWERGTLVCLEGAIDIDPSGGSSNVVPYAMKSPSISQPVRWGILMGDIDGEESFIQTVHNVKGVPGRVVNVCMAGYVQGNGGAGVTALDYNDATYYPVTPLEGTILYPSPAYPGHLTSQSDEFGTGSNPGGSTADFQLYPEGQWAPVGYAVVTAGVTGIYVIPEAIRGTSTSPGAGVHRFDGALLAGSIRLGHSTKYDSIHTDGWDGPPGTTVGAIEVEFYESGTTVSSPLAVFDVVRVYPEAPLAGARGDMLAGFSASTNDAADKYFGLFAMVTDAGDGAALRSIKGTCYGVVSGCAAAIPSGAKEGDVLYLSDTHGVMTLAADLAEGEKRIALAQVLDTAVNGGMIFWNPSLPEPEDDALRPVGAIFLSVNDAVKVSELSIATPPAETPKPVTSSIDLTRVPPDTGLGGVWPTMAPGSVAVVTSPPKVEKFWTTTLAAGKAGLGAVAEWMFSTNGAAAMPIFVPPSTAEGLPIKSGGGSQYADERHAYEQFDLDADPTLASCCADSLDHVKYMWSKMDPYCPMLISIVYEVIKSAGSPTADYVLFGLDPTTDFQGMLELNFWRENQLPSSKSAFPSGTVRALLHDYNSIDPHFTKHVAPLVAEELVFTDGFHKTALLFLPHGIKSMYDYGIWFDDEHPDQIRQSWLDGANNLTISWNASLHALNPTLNTLFLDDDINLIGLEVDFYEAKGCEKDLRLVKFNPPNRVMSLVDPVGGITDTFDFLPGPDYAPSEDLLWTVDTDNVGWFGESEDEGAPADRLPLDIIAFTQGGAGAAADNSPDTAGYGEINLVNRPSSLTSNDFILSIVPESVYHGDYFIFKNDTGGAIRYVPFAARLEAGDVAAGGVYLDAYLSSRIEPNDWRLQGYAIGVPGVLIDLEVPAAPASPLEITSAGVLRLSAAPFTEYGVVALARFPVSGQRLLTPLGGAMFYPTALVNPDFVWGYEASAPVSGAKSMTVKAVKYLADQLVYLPMKAYLSGDEDRVHRLGFGYRIT